MRQEVWRRVRPGFWPVRTAGLFRIPRFYPHYGIVAAGVSLFNGKA